MNAEVVINLTKYHVDFSQSLDISIPIIFNGEQPNTYGVAKASSVAYQDNEFIGDRRKGGPCNFETYSITPHCNGTHTECIGHITNERVSILSSLKDILIASTLVTVFPKSSNDSYIPNLTSKDLVITKDDLLALLDDTPDYLLKGLIIRTLPNTDFKKSQDYMKNPPSFLSNDAMTYIRSRGVQHLLIDTPSVDRLFDEGNLSSHNIFWNTKNKNYNTDSKDYTITEMIYVDNNIEDGSYLLNLQIAPFVSDASPSRPIIFKLNEL
jgi:arylformamidase